MFAIRPIDASESTTGLTWRDLFEPNSSRGQGTIDIPAAALSHGIIGEEFVH
jgi:hypothetical protein